VKLDPKEQIDIALGSIGRVKVIACLARSPRNWQSAYSIALDTKLDRTQVKKTMQHLVRCGWLEASDPPIRQYRINSSNRLVCAFLEFLRVAQYANFD
jgi:hypothetical protein